MNKRASISFRLGRVVITRAALEILSDDEVRMAIARHARGDWGDVTDEDRQENELSLKEGFRLFSVYHMNGGRKFWIITEADRSATTIFLPEDH